MFGKGMAPFLFLEASLPLLVFSADWSWESLYLFCHLYGGLTLTS